MKYLVLLNGKPRSGKDTFAHYSLSFTSGKRYSSIDPTIKAVAIAGYDYANDTEKNDKDRAFLSEQKMLFDKYYNTSFNYIVDLIDNHHEVGDVIFYDVREIENIEELKIYYSRSERKVKCISLFIENDSITRIPSNDGDMSTLLDYNYDYIINNDGTLVDLRDKAEQFIDRLKA